MTLLLYLYSTVVCILYERNATEVLEYCTRTISTTYSRRSVLEYSTTTVLVQYSSTSSTVLEYEYKYSSTRLQLVSYFFVNDTFMRLITIRTAYE
jgi:hypothetical protein